MDDDGFLQIIRSLTEEDTNIFNDLLDSPKILSTCNNNFSNKNNLKLHSGEKPFSCKDCKRKFSTLRGLKSHLVSCLKPENQKLKFSPKIFGCKICKKKFVSKVNLTLHSKSHNNQYIYNCQTCGKGFNRNNNFKVHLRTHTEEKPFGCTLCTKKYCSNQSLQIHILTEH